MVFGGKFQRRESLDFRPYTGESSHHLRRGKEMREVREFLGEGFQYTIGRNVDWESSSLMALVSLLRVGGTAIGKLKRVVEFGNDSSIESEGVIEVT